MTLRDGAINKRFLSINLFSSSKLTCCEGKGTEIFLSGGKEGCEMPHLLRKSVFMFV
jgi:hypothetical protein